MAAAGEGQRRGASDSSLPFCAGCLFGRRGTLQQRRASRQTARQEGEERRN